MFLIMEPSAPLHFFPLRSKYSSGHSVLKNTLDLISSHNVRDKISDPYKTKDNLNLGYTMLLFSLPNVDI